jgi:hypothetical protein
MYLQYLRRNADSFGLTGFTQAMHTLSEEALIAIVLGSQEYFALAV